jgi:hypothetical protein
LMPQLGEAVEPARGHAPMPWWRAVDAPQRAPAPQPAAGPEKLPKSMPWPFD